MLLGRRLITSVTLALGLLVSRVASADDEPTVMREEEILGRWMHGSAEVAAWRKQVGASRFDVITARLLPNPELNLQGIKVLSGTPPDGETGVQAQLTVPLPIFGQIGGRIDAAEAQVTVAEANLLLSTWSRAADIQAEIVSTAFAEAKIVMLNRNLQELVRIERIVTTRAAAGASGQYDVLRVGGAAANIRGAITSSAIAKRRSEARLLALIADPTLRTVTTTPEGLTSFRGPEDENALVEHALKRRPDLEVARRSVNAAQASATRYRKDAIPTPSVYIAGYSVQKESAFQLSGGLILPLPIFDRNQGQIGRSLNEAQAQELVVAALTARIRAEVAGLWRARRDATVALKEFRERTLTNAQQLLQRAEVTYQAGTFSIAELLDAYRTLWEARIEELELERQRAEAEAELERAAVLLPLPSVH